MRKVYTALSKKSVKMIAFLFLTLGLVNFSGCKTAPKNSSVESAIPKKASTVEINDIPYDIVEFGMWPQSKKEEGVTVGKDATKINGWSCYKGSDGFYYVKEIATPASWCDETEFTKNNEYYFKMEPIKWRVLTTDYKEPGENTTNKKLLFSEKILFTHIYDLKSNKYDTSNIRKYLNGEFLKKAFTPEEIASISTTKIDNSAPSTFGKGEKEIENQYACDDTNDKVFLLSEKEITNEEYGFDAFNIEDENRVKKTTPYVRAKGASFYTDKDLIQRNFDPKLKYAGFYFLRSPRSISLFLSTKGKDYVRDVSGNGNAYTSSPVYLTSWGIVPALTISF